MQGNDQPLAETLLAAAGVRVATRFLGMDQRHNKIGPPVLWETTIFGGLHDLHQERYTSQTAALKGHAKAVAFAKNQAAEMQGSDSATAMPASQAADRE